MFETQTNPWIIHERESDRGLHHQLIALLLQHEGAKLENLPQVPQRLRLWLADYYETQRDPRCVSVAQSILDELSPPTTSGQNMLAYQALERVSWFYRDTQQNEKCAQEWLSWRAYVNSPDWTRADMYLEAARALERVGSENAAQVEALRRQVIEIGDPWTVGLATYDQAAALIESGRQEPARAMLKQPLAQAQGAPIEVAFLSLLASSYLKSGQVDLAFDTARKTIKAYRALPDPIRFLGIPQQAERAREVLTYCQLHQLGIFHPVALTSSLTPATVPVPTGTERDSPP